MATNESYVVTSHNTLNYSGILFAKGNAATPFVSMIGGNAKRTTAWEFPINVNYTIGGGSSQPAITETASLTAPNPTKVARTQVTNVAQIFQEQVAISYAKKSSMGQMSGVYVAGQYANPPTEEEFQIAAALKKMRKDVEYTFLNGAFQRGGYDDVAYKTLGMTAAITTNAIAASSAALGYWLVAELVESIATHDGDPNSLVLMVRPENLMQLNADAVSNGLTIVDEGRTINGIKVKTLVTPNGDINVIPNSFLASGTALAVNPGVCAPVYLDVPGKGNFFVEDLAKTGAADKKQLYGQVGLDYGAEWMHGKITGLATSFTKPTYSKTVYVAGGTIQTTTP